MSVVIPTRNRPPLLVRAVDSVLAQTYTDLEIVVIVDGPDPDTATTMAAIADPRLRCIVLDQSVGGGEARNEGARRATGNWVAYLDDDDEWMPEKLAQQMLIAEREGPGCFVSCRYVDRTLTTEIVQPFQPPAPNQPISEYLFCGVSMLGFTAGFLQTSTWLAERESFLKVPFTKGLARNQDTDWLIRAIPELDLKVFVVWKTLSIFHNEATTGRITTQHGSWQYTLNWAKERQAYFTKRAFPYFLATNVMFRAQRQDGGFKAFREIFHVAAKYGSITPRSLWQLIANFYVFPYGRFGIRSRLQNFMTGKDKKKSSEASL
ncbi:glycosyltransferase family 2 protein [Bryocella elongata]|uniref:glycosyltransferase family 2 protein n=1 Tax=Bryocella elongata TaxID=863522 RepID=UPI001359C606|nr:glycosyltransferase family 2 protein [Bryocella elongata]